MKVDETQNIPIFYDIMYQMEKHFEFEFDQKYSIEYLPSNVSFENEMIAFSLASKLKDDILIYDLKFQQKTPQLNVEDFSKWNQSIKKISNALNESVKINLSNAE